MNQLLPIIRRVRRPLLVVDLPPVVVGNVEPVKLTAETVAESQAEAREELPEPTEPQAPNVSDAEAST